MKKTKLVATIGPASMDYKVLKKLVHNGLNVVRINLSHAKREDMDIIMANVKRLRKEMNVPLPVMIDTRGPEIRVKTFKNGSVSIKKGQTFVFTGRNVVGDEFQVSLNEPSIVKNVKVGNKILAVNGLVRFKVVEVQGKDIITKAMTSGVISNRKSLSLPGVKFSTTYLNNEDKKDILWGIKNDVDFVAASFVNSKNDVLSLRKFIENNKGQIKIVSKIESQCGVDNLDEIISVSDAIMVARGDLGVEVPVEKLPEIQKTMIKKCVMQGKPVITATEMLESMIKNPRPTRAEVTDVANAVYDGTSCVMLSGETAMGEFPCEAVQTMASIVEETEKHIDFSSTYRSEKIETISDIVSQSVVSATYTHDIKAVVAFTRSGLSAGLVSRFRPETIIIGATPCEKTYRQLELFWGVKPILTPLYKSTDQMFSIANDLAKKFKIANVKDRIVITCGSDGAESETNLIKIAEIQ